VNLAQVHSTGPRQVDEQGQPVEPSIGALTWHVPLALTAQPPPLPATEPLPPLQSLPTADGAEAHHSSAVGEDAGMAVAGPSDEEPPLFRASEVAASNAVRQQAEAACLAAWPGEAAMLTAALQ
jgi:hypothetical protein